MGWRDRDYAKWTDEERSRFLGSGATNVSSSIPPATYAPRKGGLIRPGAGAAILVAGALFALGRFPTSHPIVPLLHFGGSTPSVAPMQPTATIDGPSTATLGSTLNLHGSAPAGDGAVTIEGSYDAGQSWLTLATVRSANGGYAAQVPLEQRGILQLRILFADGSQAVGSINVE
jgi:hypothetical protein